MAIPKDAQSAYAAHKAGAAFRGIPFDLTLAQWWAFWAPYWLNRKTHKLQMCRTGDAGGYVMGNVRIDTKAANLAEQKYPRRGAVYDVRLLPGRTLPERLTRLEARAIRRALAMNNFNASAAARDLGLTFRQMRYALKKHTRLATMHDAASLADMQ